MFWLYSKCYIKIKQIIFFFIYFMSFGHKFMNDHEVATIITAKKQRNRKTISRKCVSAYSNSTKKKFFFLSSLFVLILFFCSVQRITWIWCGVFEIKSETMMKLHAIESIQHQQQQQKICWANTIQKYILFISELELC